MRDELDINALERRVDDLIRLADRLRDENQALREQQTSLLAERTVCRRKRSWHGPGSRQ